MNPVIVIAAFSRPKSLSRILASVENAIYPTNKIKLIVSLDGGASKEVIKVASEFKFSKGDIEIVTRDINLGLREHILWCGDLSFKYGSAIILEDDLYVDPYFYLFATAALSFYKDMDDIAGIALYSPQFNEYANLPFYPLQTNYSNYFIQVPCSWGQAWTAEQWSAFKIWYEKSDQNQVQSCLQLPEVVKGWPESSWKKYFYAYILFNNKYFLYPYRSYTTNCSDSGGVHIKNACNMFQVSLASPFREPDEFNFCTLEKHSVMYDGFMEPISLNGLELTSIKLDEIEYDFYGIKPIPLLREKEWCITSKKCLRPELKIPLRFKPFEANLSFISDNSINNPISLCRSKDVRQETIIDKARRDFILAEYLSGLSIGSKRIILGTAISIFIRLMKGISKTLVKRP